MGGSGGGSRSHGRPSVPVVTSVSGSSGAGGSVTAANPCARLNVVVTLQSPHPEVARTVREGQQLRVQLTPDDAIAAVTEDGRTAGAVIPPDIDTLLDCLRRGHRYVA